MLRGVPQASGEGVPPNGWLYPYPVQDVRADDYFSVRGLEQRLKDAEGLPVDPKAAAEVARRGDDVGGKVFSAYGTALGSFLSPFIADFRAAAVIVLGGIAEAFDLFGPSLREVVSIPVSPGNRGPDAAMLGAVQLLTESLTG